MSFPLSPRSSRAQPTALDRELDALFPSITSKRTRAHSLDSGPDSPIISTIHPAWKRNLYLLLEHPTSSPAAFTIHVMVTSLILCSAGVTVLETIPLFHSTSPSVWFGIETSLVALFTVEYIARALAWSFDWGVFMGWFLSFFGIVDLLAILPYYIEIILQLDTSVIFRFSILRTFRLLRVFRAFRTNNTIVLTIEVMYLSVKRSQHALLALGFFVCMFLVIFSTILYFAERGTWDPILETFIDADGDPTQFSSIPAAAWFVLITITTVGYGEIVPHSFLGRLITVPLLICGLLMIALPSFVLGREFSKVWEIYTQREQEGVEGYEMSGGNDVASPTSAALSSQILDLQASLDSQSQVLRRLVRHLGIEGGKDKDTTMLRPRPRVSISRSLSPGRSSYDGEGEDDVVDGFEKAQRRMRREVKAASGTLGVGVSVGATVNGDAAARWKGKERERDKDDNFAVS